MDEQYLLVMHFLTNTGIEAYTKQFSSTAEAIFHMEEISNNSDIIEVFDKKIYKVVEEVL